MQSIPTYSGVVALTDGAVSCTCCDCTEYVYKYKTSRDGGIETCPNSLAPIGDPCHALYNGASADCANYEFTFDIKSREFGKICTINKTPKAQIVCSFDDFGSVTGDSESLECNNTSSCNSCTVTGTLTPQVLETEDNKVILLLTVNGFNAYWGGPWGARATVLFYWE